MEVKSLVQEARRKVASKVMGGAEGLMCVVPEACLRRVVPT